MMRAIWTGTIQFGLVYIPIKIFPATSERRIDLNFIRKRDHCPIANVRICKETGEEVAFEEIVRGYEYDPGAYIEVSDKDFKSAEQEQTDTIAIIDFVPENEISRKFFEKPYYIEPADQKKGYIILTEVLKKSSRVAIVRFMLKTQENLGIIFVEDDHLILNQIRFSSQIQPPCDIPSQSKNNISSTELDTALALTEKLSSHFNPEKYRDTFNLRLKKIIRNKIEGKKESHAIKTPIPTSSTEMKDKLQQSLDYAQKGLLSA